jgi:hypothetical protein
LHLEEPPEPVLMTCARLIYSFNGTRASGKNIHRFRDTEPHGLSPPTSRDVI